MPPPGPGYPGAPSTVDELVSGAARQGGGGGAHGDEIDRLIRAAEQGSHPPSARADDAAAAGGEKKGKSKDKNMRMVYGDSEVSPEEKMALLPRYAVAAA